MDGRDRFLTALANERPDRLPCQVHSWMGYYLHTYLGGADQYQAYARFGMDPVIYAGPRFVYAPADLAAWQTRRADLGVDSSGQHRWRQETMTPSGTLVQEGAYNEFTGWTTRPLVRDEADFAVWERHVPVPVEVDWAPVAEAKRRIGATGIVRGGYFDFGQGSPWQSLCILMDIQPAIMAAMDNPQWVHHALQSMQQKKLRVIELGGRIELDLVETGGGAGSNTVISPSLHEQFCLPYDVRQHEALHAHGARVVYHLCGGLMKMLDLVARNGADGLETMTPPAMGGDCDLAAAARRVGERLFFIGGFDQNRGFEKGTPELAARMVRELHACRPYGGYICCPSDHFFFGEPATIQAFADAARACTYT